MPPTPHRDRRAILRRLTAQLGALCVLASVIVVGGPPSAGAAGTMLLSDSFTGATVSSSSYRVGGSSFTPCLTASGTGASTPGRCSGASDAAGSGALRLTPAVGDRTGFLLYDQPLPTKAGLDIEFNFYQYGGNGADGISFFLADGAHTLTAPGAAGGALGYHVRGAEPGLNHGLLGVGFDAWGNYGHEWNDAPGHAGSQERDEGGVTCDTSVLPNGLRPDSIAVRGPMGANQYDGYCLLGSPVTVPGGIDNTGTSTRGAALRQARIVIDPPGDASPKVRVYVDGTLRVTVDQPPVLATTPTFKFGWAASTGGSHNVHEINFLAVESVVPIAPELSVTAAADATVRSGETANLTFTPHVDAAGGPETQSVTTTVAVATGATFASTPSGTGWSCTAPVGNSATCTHTPGSTIAPGTSLPAITVPVTSAGSGNVAVTATVDSTDNGIEPARAVTATATVQPVAAPLAGIASAAAVDPATVQLQPSAPIGTGPFAYELATSPAPADGTATIDAGTGRISFTPAAGASGRSQFSYRARGADGVWSDVATVTVDTRPVAPSRSATTTYATPTTFGESSAPVGTGPFTYSIAAAPPANAGSASMHPATGSITFTPAASFSGPVTFTYRVTDGDGIPSPASAVAVTVQPTSTDLSGSVALDADGNGSATTSAPVPDGSGPFTYSLAGAPSHGTATVDPATGVVTYDAATDVSGTFDAQYTVVDANSVGGPARTATFTVHPYTSIQAAGTDARLPVTTSAPTTRGSGPFTYAVTPPAGVTTTIDPDTGEITLDPGDRSGTFSFTYTATDAHGVSSGPVAVTVTVRPVLTDLRGDAISSASPAAVDLDATPVGDGPFTYEVVESPDPAHGTASATATGVRLVPAAGVQRRPLAPVSSDRR